MDMHVKGANTIHATLDNVVYVPRAPNNLFSIPQLMVRGGTHVKTGQDESVNLFNKYKK